MARTAAAPHCSAGGDGSCSGRGGRFQGGCHGSGLVGKFKAPCQKLPCPSGLTSIACATCTAVPNAQFRVVHSNGSSWRTSPTRWTTRSAPPCSATCASVSAPHRRRSEEHTSELQSLAYLVCRLLLEKKKKQLMSSQL